MTTPNDVLVCLMSFAKSTKLSNGTISLLLLEKDNTIVGNKVVQKVTISSTKNADDALYYKTSLNQYIATNNITEYINIDALETKVGEYDSISFASQVFGRNTLLRYIGKPVLTMMQVKEY